MVTEDLIVKCIAGEAEEHEVTLVSNWRKLNEENNKKYLQFEKVWISSGSLKDKSNFDIETAWAKTNERLSKGKIVRFAPYRKVWLAAASVIVLIGISIITYMQFESSQFQEFTVASQTMKQIELQDGSSVVLKNGEFSYPEKFNSDNRTVSLKQGTAFFKIKRDTTKPFRIHSNHTEITVLGTEFEIQTNPEFTKVSVHSGKVKFTSPTEDVILTKGMSATYNTKMNRIAESDIQDNNSMSYATWRVGF
ncbi:MAG: FecR family protein [Bacteroidia bacterium]